MSKISDLIESLRSKIQAWKAERQAKYQRKWERKTEERKRRDEERKRRQEEERQRRERERKTYRIGNDFESYVITIFDKEKFILTHRTPTDEDTNGRYVRSMVYPDLRFREKSTGREFWVECKYRYQPEYDGSVIWCSDTQLKNYLKTQYNTRVPVYVILGMGGSSKCPDVLYCFRVDENRFTHLFYNRYRSKKIAVRNITSLDDLEIISRT